jgi:hypothetical protein
VKLSFPIVRTLWAASVAFALAGCATTDQQKVDRASRLTQKTPFSEIPALWAKLERQGQLPPAVRKTWMAQWEQQKAQHDKVGAAYRRQINSDIQAERRMLASMSPAQRAEHQRREAEVELMGRQLAMQQSEYAAVRRQAAAANFANTLQNQQMINAYNQRTQTLSQPVNVNVYHHQGSRSFINPGNYGGY